MKGQWIRYSAEELAWIEGHRDLPRAAAHAEFVQRFNRPDVSLVNYTGLCKRKGWLTGRTGQFKSGHTNSPSRKGHCFPGSEKGWFKTGNRTGRANQNHKPIGTERFSHKDGYLERKVNEDLPLQARWRAVHLIRWEERHGPVPDGHCLKCLDGNKLNTDPDNWLLIPRALMPRLVGRGRAPQPYDSAPAEIKPTLLAVAKLEHAVRTAKGRTGT